MQVEGIEEHWDISLDTVGRTTIYLDAAGGALAETELDLVYGSPYGKLPEPTNIETGHSFLGWYTKDGKEILETSIVSKSDGDTLTARYGANTYQLIYETNGGGELTSKNVSYDSFYGELPTPTRTGYTFLGWYKEDSYINEVTEKTKFYDTNDVTIYAKWEANSYTVTFHPYGGTIDGKDKEERNFDYDSTYTDLPIPEYEGYTFAGWFTDTNFITEIKNGDTVKLTNNTTLYAKWNVNTYTVSFNTDGGSSESSKNVTFHSTYGDLPTPTKSGYSFVEWQDESGTKITSTTRVTLANNHTLKAIWQVNNYKVTFYAQAGTTTETERTIAYGSKYGTLPTASLTRYTFTGWYTQASGGDLITENSTMNSTTGIALYAHYDAIKSKVSFDSNGGNVISTVITVTYGSTYATSLPTPTKAGHTFLGWYTEKTGGIKIEGSSTVSITEDQTLFAHWKVDSYTIHVIATNTTVLHSELTVAYGSSVELSITPNSGHYIASVSCDNGYTTNALTGFNVRENKNITISNNNYTTGSTCTITSLPVNFYNMMREQSKPDTDVDLGKTSAATNTNGVYQLTKVSGLSDQIYYYRGAVDNNVIFAGFCWKIIRTTETQGIKLIYNGVPTNGTCVATGADATIGTSAFNTTVNETKYVGYIVDGNNSAIKGVIDTWYISKMASYTSKLEDTPFYNEKTPTSYPAGACLSIGFPAGIRILGLTNGNCQAPFDEYVSNPKVILGQGVPSTDNYVLKVGLITTDEVVLAGGRGWGSDSNLGANSSYYLRNGTLYYTMSPLFFMSTNVANVFSVSSNGSITWNGSVKDVEDVRPVISLKPGTDYSKGDGSKNNPFVVS